TFRFREIGACFVGKVDDGACDFEVAQRRIATARRHCVDAVDGVLEQGIVTLGDKRLPSPSVAQLGCTGHACSVARGTGGGIDLFARALLAAGSATTSENLATGWMRMATAS